MDKLNKKLSDAIAAYGGNASTENYKSILDIVSEIQVMGRVEGLNDARIMVWGIGYDKDDTALMMRKRLTDRIFSLSEPYDLARYIRRTE